MISDNNGETLYYGYTDNQGSLVALTDQNGNVVEKYAYDPWGARRNPTDWRYKDTRSGFITNRGYTGHEHLEMFNIINMNGRVYDPLTAMFFSPDPFIQAPDNWLNYNRYGYCMNNPTNYTDPSGYIRDDGPQIPTPVDPNPQLPFLDNGGCGSYLRDWSNNQGQMTYNWDNNRYEYANGNQVSYNEVYNNYILPHSWFTVYGNDAVNVYSSFRYGDSNTNRALNNIGISVKDAISALPSSLGIMVSLSQEFANANQGNIFITGMDGAETMITTGQLTGGLELASKYSLIGGIGIEAILSLSGNVDARQNFGSDTMVSIALFTISAAGCGVPALILTVGWVMYRAHAFDGMEIPTIHYQPSNYNPNSMPQDAIRPQYPLKDGPQPIYFHY